VKSGGLVVVGEERGIKIKRKGGACGVDIGQCFTENQGAQFIVFFLLSVEW